MRHTDDPSYGDEVFGICPVCGRIDELFVRDGDIDVCPCGAEIIAEGP